MGRTELQRQICQCDQMPRCSSHQQSRSSASRPRVKMGSRSFPSHEYLKHSHKLSWSCSPMQHAGYPPLQVRQFLTAHPLSMGGNLEITVYIHYVMSYHVTPCHVTPCHAMSPHVTSCHVKWWQTLRFKTDMTYASYISWYLWLNSPARKKNIVWMQQPCRENCLSTERVVLRALCLCLCNTRQILTWMQIRMQIME